MDDENKILKKIFKGYDIRGIYPNEINTKIVAHITYHLVKYIKSDIYLIGYDTRISSPLLAGAIIDVLTILGKKVVNFGIVPTEVIYWYSGSMNKPGLIVTASHNNAPYNGLKVCRAGSAPVSLDDILGEILKDIINRDCSLEEHDDKDRLYSSDSNISLIGEKQDLVKYKDFVRSNLPKEPPKKNLRIGIDASNGAAYLMVEEIFQNTQDIDFIKINTEPNGLFPNHDPNPLIEANCRQLKELILKEKLDFGFIFDGDADRCCFLDSQGNGIHPYMVYLILLRSLPKGSCVVKSILISPLLELDNEIEVHESKVGHSHMKNVMRKHKAVFGAEHSAHYYYSDFFFSDSGLLTATKIITAIVESGINDIMHQFKYHSLPLKLPETNYALAANKIDELGKKLLELYPDAELSHIDGLSLIDKHKKFWLNIRASNTESNCVRVNIEAFEQLKAQKISDQLNGLIEKL